MPCFSPNKLIKPDDRFIYPRWLQKGRNGYYMVPRDCKQVLVRNRITGVISTIFEDDMIFVKCGQCKGCRLAESVEKANRCTLETYSHAKNYFLTLTYNDDNLVFGYERPTLVRDHIELFNKNLRRQLDYHGLVNENENPMKIMYCGEYGSLLRPHYHGIYCGLSIPDLQYYKTTFNGDILMTSPFLSKIWKKGFVVIGQADWQSSAYVARYVMKKHKGQDKSYYSDNFIEPEFCQCSTKLGAEYYEKYKDKIFSEDKIILPDKQKGFRQIAPPRTFNSWFEAESPEDFEKIKSKRQENAKRLMEFELSKTDLDRYDYLEAKRLNFENRIKALKRSAC